MLRDTIRRFMAEEVKPVEDTVEHDAWRLPPDKLLPLQKKARDLGLWCFETPAEHGGAGLSLLGQCVAAEEAAKCRMGAYIAGCGAFGVRSAAWSGKAPNTSSVSPARRHGEGHQGLRGDQRAQWRLRSCALDPDPRRAQERPLRDQRHQDLDLWRRHGEMGHRVCAGGREQGPRRHHQLHRRQEQAGHQPVQDPGHPLLRALRGALRQLRSADRRPSGRRRQWLRICRGVAHPRPPAVCGRHHRHRAGGAGARHRVGRPSARHLAALWPRNRRSSG